jgi:capsular polysaccharide biosynthesis protein
VLDFLPRLLPLLDRLKNAKLLLAAGHSSWQLRYLHHFGVRESQIVEQGSAATWCERLWLVPPAFAAAKLAEPSRHREVAKRLAEAIPRSVSDVVPIFVSRDDAPDKKLRNEADLVQRCASVLGDIRKIEVSGLSLAEQIAVFEHAPVIVGAVGQGLVNTLFSRGAMCLVLTPETEFRERSWGRAYHLISLLAGSSAVTLKAIEKHDEHKNWSYDPDRFAELLRLAWMQHQRNRRQGE